MSASHPHPPCSTVIRRHDLPGLSLSVLDQPTERKLPGHGHERAYLSFLVAGSYRERCGSMEIEQVAPTVVFHPAGLEHVDAYGRQGGRFLIVKLERWWLDAWGGRTTTEPIEIGGPAVLRNVWELYLDMLSPDAPLALDAEARAAELLAEMTPPRAARDRGIPSWLGRIVERLGAEYVAPPSMTCLARDSGVDPAHLSRAFRKYVGCTPTDFVQRRRIRHVWQGLVQSDSPPLSDLARTAGFSDQSHCTRIFNRYVGSPPGAFRRRWAELA